MSDEQQFPSKLGQIYAQLKQHDVEQFYAGYQWWDTQRRIIALQEEIDTLRQQIDENAWYMQEACPPAVALATLARLQANGVRDLDLLDRMMERGEEWLDLIVQRLDYCEQLDFIHDNYTQWCENALEGAYDWIDSMRDADADILAVSSGVVDTVTAEATEELLLRKLTSEEEEEEAQPSEATLEGAEASLSPPAPAVEEIQPIAAETLPIIEELENVAEIALYEEEDGIASSPADFVEQEEVSPPSEEVAEFDSSQIAQAEQHVHPRDEASYVEDRNTQEPVQQETEMPLLLETTATVEAEANTTTISTEQQDMELALVLDALLSTQVDLTDNPLVDSGDQDANQLIVEADFQPELLVSIEADTEVNPTIASLEQGADQQRAELTPTIEEPPAFEVNVEADSNEPHNEQVAETVPALEAPLAIETEVEIPSPVEATPEVVHTAEESVSQEHIEPAPAEKVKPRGFWQWLLALFAD